VPKLQELSLPEISGIDCDSMTLIIPFSALEPVGSSLPLGSIQAITATIADELSLREDCLVTPQITIPYATPMQGFRGVLSLRRTVFMNLLADTVLSACSWGVTRILFLDGTSYAKPSVDSAMKKFKRKLPEGLTYGIISWQNDSSLKKAIPLMGDEIVNRWRNDSAIELLYSEITNRSVDSQRDPNRNISDELFQQWSRRGKDPEKLVKYFPNGELSSWGNLVQSEPLLPLLTTSINSNLDKGFIFHGI